VNIIIRLWNILRGRTEDLVDRLERPEDQLKLFLSELNDQVHDLQRSVAGAIADEKRLQKEIEALTSQSNEWESRAVMALEDQNEDLARAALVKQEECDSQASIMRAGWESQKQATGQLKESLKLARSRMGEARRKYNLLLAQYKSAQTKKAIQGAISGTASDSPMALMEELEDKIRRVESEAEAELALSAEIRDTDLETQFHRIEQKRKGADRLAELKAKLAERGRIGAGSESSGDRIADLKHTLDE
jgi:phage shock protein A